MLAKKLHRVALIAAYVQAHPNQVHMIGHQNISWTEKTFASCSVQEQFAEVLVK